MAGESHAAAPLDRRPSKPAAARRPSNAYVRTAESHPEVSAIAAGSGKRASGAVVKTSSSHPITVSWVDASKPDGCIALSYCPGKNLVRDGIRWERSLAADLAHLKNAHGVTVVVCLLSDAELRAIGVPRGYAEAVRASGLEIKQLGIVEMFAPETS
ncbi:hypothetical protein T484DRAFT_1781887 [Baffinella frigidus]|nr:hypothetical protein T484DRAFT_1781887 [Cryptophyta sp. CCMP2293]